MVVTSPVHIEAELLARRRHADHLFELEFRVNRAVAGARPGQFVMLGPIGELALDPFLCRPFSIYRADGEKLSLLVAVVGRGTRLLLEIEPPARLGMLGPLGNGFRVPAAAREIVLVAGGLGVAPLAFLAERLARQGRSVLLVVGVRSAAGLPPLRWLVERGVQVEVASEDGSRGRRGTAIDVLGRLLAGRQLPADSTYLAGCGPRAMLQALHRLTKQRGWQVEVSLENRMACGTGACLGCTLQLAGGENARVCREGPVFAAGEVFL
ncbi:MAG: dihydroorotate dehydrogenase electron transfer subunit [Deltaproteobacteria bacterium]|nr:MAG: dihydroorotate dehydrogenase electron transfer subunit [Deltaproteobacteria bacterium]